MENGKIGFAKYSRKVGLFACLVAQLHPTLCDPIDCSPPGSSVHGILQARILEWVTISFSRGTSWLKDGTCVSCVVGGFFTTEPPEKPWMDLNISHKDLESSTPGSKLFLIDPKFMFLDRYQIICKIRF